MNKNNIATIAIIDYGSQYTQLIARRVRELNIYSEIFHHSISIDKLLQKNIKGIILSGGPNSVYDKKAPKIKPDLCKIDSPIGITSILHFLPVCLSYAVLSPSVTENRDNAMAAH